MQSFHVKGHQEGDLINSDIDVVLDSVLDVDLDSFLDAVLKVLEVLVSLVIDDAVEVLWSKMLN